MPTEKKKNIHAGHRQRMKDEFLARGLEGMPDHRALELLLFYAIPQGDVNPLAHALIDRFGSFSGVLHATYDQLLSVKGVGRSTAALILLIPAMGGRYLQECADLHGVYQSSWQFRDLLQPEFFGLRNEQVCLVCLDRKMKLIACRKVGEGFTDSAVLNSRRIMETALACNAGVVVLAHNHVGGLAIPSDDDVQTTQQLAISLRQVDIFLYDHVIIADGEMVSMRDSGYFEKIDRIVKIQIVNSPFPLT